METKVLSGKEAIKLGAELIKKGEVVAFPTETVYGLGANALNIDAVKKIFIAKGRPQDNPLIVHVSKKSDIDKLVDNIPNQAKILIDALMPGPITIVMKKAKLISNLVTAGLDSVGIRMPINEIAREFIEECGCPIAAPSANISSKISPTTAEHVFEDMNGRIPLIIDGGYSNVGIESTVIDLSGDMPTILRPGIITKEQIAKLLGEVKTFKGETIKIMPSPGMRYKHYSPSVETILCVGADVLKRKYDEYEKIGKKPILLVQNETIKQIGDRRLINLGNSDKEVAHNIYLSMHKAEKISKSILIEYFDGEGVFESIMNRLLKSASGHIER